MKRFIHKWWRTYLLTVSILAAVDWFLLWPRFYWFGFQGTTKAVYTVLNFPCSYIYFWIEAKRNPWWYSIFGTHFEVLLNEEFGPLLVWLLLCLIQAAIFIAISAARPCPLGGCSCTVTPR